MTEEQVVLRFKRSRPFSVLDVLVDCHVPLQYIDDGSFRNVFKVVGLPLVVKVPKDIDNDEREHAQTEVRVYRKVMRFPKYESIRKYMPEILYYGRGVSLMRWYKAASLNEEIREKIAQEVGNVLDVPHWDWHGENFGIDTNGNIVLLDLGCLTPDYAYPEGEFGS